jgi:two-component system response regulator YesN
MKNPDIYDQVKKHIMSVPDEEFARLSVSTLAYRFNICRFKLSREFKLKNAMTLEQFLFTEKMARAAFLFNYHGNSIKVKEVAEKMGYCNSDYFIRKFREYYGIVPGQYKQYKTDISRNRKNQTAIKKDNSKDN